MFSWSHMRGHPRVPDGAYACDVIDQHQVNWCGACYLVAAAQMVQDRAQVALKARDPHKNATSASQLSLQTLMDHFEDEDVIYGWNVCHGGHPLDVLQCIETGVCPLVIERAPRPLWMGFARATQSCPKSDVCDFRVVHSRRIHPSQVASQLWSYGPVVLEVSAQLLRSADANGVVRDQQPRPTNHAVCVIGRHSADDGTVCWVVRNSWGTSRVPRGTPPDYTECVAVGSNRCMVDWDFWQGDPKHPGFCYIPTSHPSLHETYPSPWIVCDIEVD